MSETAHVSIRTAAGEIVTGPVRGCGGMIGNGASQCDDAKVAAHVRKRVEAMIETANDGAVVYAMVYPDFCAESNGEAVAVDLRGAKVEWVGFKGVPHV